MPKNKIHKLSDGRYTYSTTDYVGQRHRLNSLVGEKKHSAIKTKTVEIKMQEPQFIKGNNRVDIKSKDRQHTNDYYESAKRITFTRMLSIQIPTVNLSLVTNL